MMFNTSVKKGVVGRGQSQGIILLQPIPGETGF